MSQLSDGEMAERQAAYVARVIETVAKHGWMIQGVFGGIPWSYTVGLAAKGQPELAITGLDANTAGRVLNGVAGRMVHDLLPITQAVKGQLMGDYELRPTPCRLDNPDYPMSLARVYAQVSVPPLLTAVQLLWPDTAQRYPTHRSYDAKRHPQPCIGA